MQKELKTTRYTNQSTGEYREKQSFVDIMHTDEGYMFWINKSSIKTFIDQVLPKEFTWSERGRIDALKHYILKDNQLLVYRSNSHIKPITSKEMGTILEMSDRQCKAFIKKLKKHGIIKEISFDAMKYFAFNPIYGFKGKRLTINVYIFFQEELNSVLPKRSIDYFSNQVKELMPNIRVVK